MTEVLQHRAERLKLARLLDVDVDRLPPLTGAPAADLAELRERLTDRLFDESTRVLGRVAAASRLVPSPIVAGVATKVFGPLLCARAAAAIDPDKAIDVGSRLPAPFLADVTVQLDPRRVAPMIAGVPESLTVPVATELARRGEHVTMGRFLAYVPDEPLRTAMGVLDDETMLRVAFVLEHKDRLDHAVGLLDPARLPGILRCAAEQDLWPEALDLLGHLSEERLGPIADQLAGLGDDVVAGLVEAACAGGLWAGLLPVVRHASPEACRRLAAAPAFTTQRALEGIVETAATEGLWPDLAPLLAALPARARTRAAAAAGRLDPEVLAPVVERALDDDAARAPLLDLVERMRPAARARVREAAALVGRAEDLEAALA
ncbi:hypothetical protein [Nocardioides litoris]|uniref:hypothetical protein n=1 Tax=Nocardioides litoris TaxID=1926648 RepID=UPI0011232C75|nr:hypothetical protein [Nocardioides litoris]